LSVTAYIGVGSNLDQPVDQVKRAIEALDRLPGSRCTAVSPLYRNPPMGPPGQPDYVNAVAAVETALEPRKLLLALQDQEARAGRRRNGQRWGPRPLDLDILLYGDQVIADPGLDVPHPGVVERAFVLVPLAAIAPDLRIPGAGVVSRLRAAIDAEALALVEDAP